MSQQLDPGLPKWTRPVSIAAYSITSLPVDIIAQTIGNIEIDIAAQSLGNVAVNIAAAAVTINVATAVGEHVDTDIISSVQLDINIAASEVTLDINIASQAAFNITIDIAAQSVGNLNIDIAAQSVNLNVKTDTGEHVDTDIISSITLDVDITAQTVGNILIDIAAQSVGNISINIAASAISLNVKTTVGEHVDTDIVSSIELDVDIAAQSVGNVAIDIAAQSVGNISINIAASAISLNVKTTGAEHVDTDIVSSIELDVDINAQSVGNINIDIAAQTLGNIDIDIAAQTVDLNIKTSGETNIVIDKLTQAAYTSRLSTISNNGATASWDVATGDGRKGKFFPRGCRGWILRVEVYCYDAGAAGGTITVYLYPFPGAGSLHSATITVPAGGSADWRNATFNVMWNYDACLIAVVSSSSDLKVGYDSGSPYDNFDSSDAGATWAFGNFRFWFSVLMRGETVGDLPVSGTLNTINIPGLGADSTSGTVVVANLTERVITIITGVGRVKRIALYSNHDDVEFRPYVDGTRIDEFALIPNNIFTAANLNAHGYTTTTPQIQLITHNVDGDSRIAMQIEFTFKRSFEIRAYHSTGANQNAQAGIVYEKLS